MSISDEFLRITNIEVDRSFRHLWLSYIIRNKIFSRKKERAEGRLCVAAHHMAALLRLGSADNNFNERDLGGDTQTRSSRGGKYK